MFPNLIGIAKARGLSQDDVAKVIDSSRQAYGRKLYSGKFTAVDCKKLMRYFDKPFDYLFYTEGD